VFLNHGVRCSGLAIRDVTGSTNLRFAKDGGNAPASGMRRMLAKQSDRQQQRHQSVIEPW
jgi:hypothetical protein